MKKPLLLYLVNLIMISGINAQFMSPNFINQDTEKYTSSFIAEWAGDTASIETYTILGNHMFGRAIHLYPEPHLCQFEFYYNTDGSIRTMDVQFYDLNNTSVPLMTKTGFLPYRIMMNSQKEVVDFRTIDQEGEKQFTHLTSRMDFSGGWIPILGQWQWLSDLVIEDKLQDDLKFLSYPIGDYDMEVTKSSNNTIVFKSDISAPITFMLDENRKIKEIDALGSPWNYTISRSDPINVADYSKRFAKKKIVGDPSPHEQFKREISGAQILMTYGRPAKRGREIFGNIVPFGEVWRTGAGPPTIFTTSKDLDFNGTIIPKGTYNLFTIPNETEWTLIFNTEEEAWGSAYRSEFDFAKIEMKSVGTDTVTEKFTIDIVKENDGAVLKMMWDRTMATMKFGTVE